MKAEEFARQQIPTMIGEHDVAGMKLTTLTSIMRGYAKLYHETEVKKLNKSYVLSSKTMTTVGADGKEIIIQPVIVNK